MKKFAALVLALTLVFALTACGGNSKEAELTVFAAASMQETLTEIGENYKKDHSNITLTFNFDSSGTLQTQIEEGAVCDIFISAGQKQMNALEEGGSILAGSRFDLLENKAALAVPEGNPAGISSFDQLRSALEAETVLLAMGNSDVPVGQYTQKIFAYWGLDETALAASGLAGSRMPTIPRKIRFSSLAWETFSPMATPRVRRASPDISSTACITLSRSCRVSPTILPSRKIRVQRSRTSSGAPLV